MRDTVQNCKISLTRLGRIRGAGKTPAAEGGQSCIVIEGPDSRVLVYETRAKQMDQLKNQSESSAAREAINGSIADVTLVASGGEPRDGMISVILREPSTNLPRNAAALVFTSPVPEEFKSTGRLKAFLLRNRPKKDEPVGLAHWLKVGEPQEREVVWNFTERNRPKRFEVTLEKGLDYEPFKPEEEKAAAAEPIEKPAEKPASEKTLKKIVGSIIKNGESKLLEEKGIRTAEDFLKAALGPSGRLALAQFKKKSGITAITKGRLEAAVKALQESH